MEIEKKVSDYSDNTNNYKIDGELTVTITLAEYRELVSKVAISDDEISKQRKHVWELEGKLKEQIEETQQLKQRLYEATVTNTATEG